MDHLFGSNHVSCCQRNKLTVVWRATEKDELTEGAVYVKGLLLRSVKIALRKCSSSAIFRGYIYIGTNNYWLTFPFKKKEECFN